MNYVHPDSHTNQLSKCYSNSLRSHKRGGAFQQRDHKRKEEEELMKMKEGKDAVGRRRHLQQAFLRNINTFSDVQ